jgi:hypothetical protein
MVINVIEYLPIDLMRFEVMSRFAFVANEIPGLTKG